jgi:hypothetical protein
MRKTCSDKRDHLKGAVVRTGRRIECWLRTIHSQDLDTFGVAVAITLD